MCCFGRFLHHRDLSCIWTCPQYRPVLLLDVSTPQVLELQLFLSLLQRPVLHPDLSKMTMDLVKQQEPVLLLDVSTLYTIGV
jgi:hypothetical protein